MDTGNKKRLANWKCQKNQNRFYARNTFYNIYPRIEIWSKSPKSALNIILYINRELISIV